MTTDHFELTIGVTAPAGGLLAYFDLGTIIQYWRELAEEEYARSEIGVPAIIHESQYLHALNRKAIPDGEPVAVISGTRNSHFITCSHQEWRQAVTRIAVGMRERLGQATCQVAFWDVEFTYIR